MSTQRWPLVWLLPSTLVVAAVAVLFGGIVERDWSRWLWFVVFWCVMQASMHAVTRAGASRRRG